MNTTTPTKNSASETRLAIIGALSVLTGAGIIIFGALAPLAQIALR